MDRSILLLIGFAIVAGIAIGTAVSYLIWGAEPPVIVETFKPTIQHDDGTVTAPVLPGQKPALPQPTKPAGGRHVRTIEVTVLPPQPTGTPAVGGPEEKPAAPACPPLDVRIDLDLYGDGMRASVWSNGEILDTADFPVENFIPTQRRHMLGLAAFTDGSKQVQYTHLMNRLAVSGFLVQAADDDLVAGVGAHITF